MAMSTGVTASRLVIHFVELPVQTAVVEAFSEVSLISSTYSFEDLCSSVSTCLDCPSGTTSSSSALPVVILDRDGCLIDSEVSWQQYCCSLAGSSLLEVWCVDRVVLFGACTHSLHPQLTMLQSCASFLEDMQIPICARCSAHCDGELLVADRSRGVQTFACQSQQIVDIGLASDDLAQSLTVAHWHPAIKPIHVTGLSAENGVTNTSARPASEWPWRLFLQRIAYREALQQQRQLLQLQHSFDTKRKADFTRRVGQSLKTVITYEDHTQQALAREEIDFAKILLYFEDLLDDVEFRNRPRDEVYLIALMKWFKCDFFSWCNKPRCQNRQHCDGRGGDMSPQGMTAPNEVEQREGWASRVELYQCQKCQQMTRFPRYNNPAYMMKHSRKGRCGEFANVFGLLCRTLGLDVQYVLDFTDHVWVEVFLPSHQRFVHCDPSERSLNSPLMYEKGWQKKLTHMLTFSRYGVSDAISRYSRQMPEVILRRNTEIVEECFVAEVLNQRDVELEVAFVAKAADPNHRNRFVLASQGGEDMDDVLRRLALGKAGFANVNDLELSVAEMQRRRAIHQYDLLSKQFSAVATVRAEELQGRISGDAEWKRQRGEIHENANITGGQLANEQQLNASNNGYSAEQKVVMPLTKFEEKLNKFNALMQSVKWKWLQTSELILSYNMFLHSRVELQFYFDGKMLKNKRVYQAINRQVHYLQIDGHRWPLCKEAVSLIYITAEGAVASCQGDACEWNFASMLQSNDASTDSFFGKVSKHSGILIIYYHSSDQSIGSNTNFLQQCQLMNTTFSDAVFEEKEMYLLFTKPSPLAQWISLPFGDGSGNYLTPNRSPGFGLPTSLEPGNAANTGDLIYPSSYRLSMELGQKSSITHDSVAWCEVADVVIQTSLLDILICKDYDTGLEKLKEKCLHNDQVVGISYVKQNVDTSVLMVYGHEPGESAKGFTLNPCFGSISWLKRSTNSPMLTSNDVNVSTGTNSSLLAYYDLGGGHHGDTLYFDSVEYCKPSPWYVSNISVWAGDNLVNGVQCSFSNATTSLERKTPMFSSHNDSPQHRNMTMAAQDRVKKVIVRKGDLIDRLEFHSQDNYVAGGGRGGGFFQVNLPEPWRLCGLFGGTGGHLHNIGIILSYEQPSSHRTPTTTANSATELEISLRRYLSQVGLEQGQCGLFQASDCSMQTVDPWRHFDAETLVHRSLRILRHIETQPRNKQIIKTAIQSTIVYMQNIAKNPQDEKYQKIKLSNQYLTQKLLSVSTQCGMIASSATFEFSLSGLECLLFGPCAFELDLASMQLKSRFNSWIWNDRVLPESQCTHRDGIRWIERYIQYLQHLQSMIVV